MQGHKISAVFGICFAACSVFHFMLVPKDIVERCANGSEPKDDDCAGISNDMCSSLLADAGPVNWIVPGTKAVETCTSGSGVTCNLVNPNSADARCISDPAGGTCELVGNCEVEYMQLSEVEVGCLTDRPSPALGRVSRLSGDKFVDSNECTDILQTHMHEISCPAGCYFSPKYKYEEEWRVWLLLSRVAMGMFAATVCGFMQDPARVCEGKCKIFSIVEILIFLVSFLGYSVSMFGVLAIPKLCSDHGHYDEMSVAAKEYYGGENHWCQQYDGATGTLVFIIMFVKAICSLCCVVGGSIVACCTPPTPEDGG
eukprot:COSAG02_NODE_8129_length_2696_cov_1.713516_2_plen_313_part_00